MDHDAAQTRRNGTGADADGNGALTAADASAAATADRADGVGLPEPTLIEKASSWEIARRRDSTFRRLLAGADAASLLVALWVGVVAVAGGALSPWGLVAAPAFVLLSKVFGLYDRDENRLRKATLDEIPVLLQLTTLATLLVFVAQRGISDARLAEPEIAAFWASLFCLLLLTRSLARVGARAITAPERCLLVASEREAAEFANKLRLQEIAAELVGVVPPDRIGMRATDPEPLDGHHALTERLAPFIDEFAPQRIIVAAGSWTPDEILHTIDDLKDTEVKLSILPPISPIASMSFDVDQLPGVALLGMRRFQLSRSSQLVKRAFDTIAAALALAVLSPLLLSIALAIKLDTRGPVFFRQPRVGRRGRHFEILKFRSMIDGADGQREALAHLNEAPALFKLSDDPRVTRVGRWLRRTSLDELPQLFNVLRGEMSLVGPRPLVIDEDEMIEGFYRSRLAIRPGITGHWQVLGSWRVPFEDMVTLDYVYVANWSLWGDIKILLRTVRYVVLRNGV